ncbi:MAG: alpha/beta hydrolase [Pseudomonadota bacterium]
MPIAKIGRIEIAYEAFGAPADPALLLIMGLGVQMIGWDENLCRELAGRGFYVVRYDHRDVGWSSKMGKMGKMGDGDASAEGIKMTAGGEKATPPYSLEDLAADAAGLLDSLGLKNVQVCGGSMGSAIAQVLGMKRPDLAAGLTLIYGSSGNPDLPPPRPQALEYLMAPQPRERTANIEHGLNLYRAVSGPGFLFEEAWHREFLARSHDRCFYPQGVVRHLAAVLAQEDRRPGLRSLAVPTLVIHGTADPLVPVECGRDVAQSIPGAELMEIPGMGHDLPHGRGPWPEILEAMVARSAKANGGSSR